MLKGMVWVAALLVVESLYFLFSGMDRSQFGTWILVMAPANAIVVWIVRRPGTNKAKARRKETPEERSKRKTESVFKDMEKQQLLREKLDRENDYRATGSDQDRSRRDEARARYRNH